MFLIKRTRTLINYNEAIRRVTSITRTTRHSPRFLPQLARVRTVTQILVYTD